MDQLKRVRGLLAEAQGMLQAAVVELQAKFVDASELEVQINNLELIHHDLGKFLDCVESTTSKAQLRDLIVKMGQAGCRAGDISWVLREQLGIHYLSSRNLSNSLEFEQYYYGLILKICRAAGISNIRR